MCYYWGHNNFRTFLAMKVAVDKLKFVMSITQVILCSYFKQRSDVLRDRLGQKSIFGEVYRERTSFKWGKQKNVLFQYKYVKYFCVSNRLDFFLLEYGVLSSCFTIVIPQYLHTTSEVTPQPSLYFIYYFGDYTSNYYNTTKSSLVYLLICW